MTKKEKIRYIILSVLLFGALIFIWFNSCNGVEASSAQSDKVQDVIENVTDTVLGTGSVDVNPIRLRKFAHAFEFTVLGVVLCHLFGTKGYFKAEDFFIIPIVGLFVGGVDECIQIFSLRVTSIIDVLIDLSGVAMAMVVYFAVYFTVKAVKRKKLKKLNTN